MAPDSRADMTAAARRVGGWAYVLGVLAIATAILALTAWELDAEADRSRADVETTTQNLAWLQSEQIDDLFERADRLVQTASNYFDDQAWQGTPDPERVNAFLRAQTALHPDIQNLRILGADGRVRFADDGLVATDFSDRGYFTRARDERASESPVIDGPFEGRVTRTSLIAISRPLRSPDGRFGGVAYATVRLDRIGRLLGTLDVGPGGIVVLRHVDLRLVARHPPSPKAPVGSREVSPDFARMITGGRTAGTTKQRSPVDQVERVYSYHRLAHHPYVVVIGRSSGDYLAGWRRSAAMLGGLAGATILLTAWAAWRLRRGERRLADAETRWRFALDSAEQGVWDLDVRSGRIYWSPRIGEMLGYPPGTFADTLEEGLDRVHPEDRERVRTTFETCKASGEAPYSKDVRLRRRDGSYVWVASNAMVVERAADGTPTRMIGTRADIGKRKQAEAGLADSMRLLEQSHRELAAKTEALDRSNAALRASEERFDYAMQAARDGIFDWDLRTGRAFLSPAYLKLIGYAPGELESSIRASWNETLHPDERERIEATVRERLQREGNLEIEYRQRCQDGSYRWLLSRALAVERDGDGRPVRVVGTHKDITLRKQRELQLREAKEAAERASQSKSQFLANMSHELRTPLNGIIGMTSVALRRATDPALLDPLGRVDGAARHLLQVINDLLDIGKIEADRLELDEVPFTLSEIQARLDSLLAPRATEKGLQFSIDLMPQAAAAVLVGDPLRLSQALLNLAGNAVKFTESGSVRIGLGLSDDGPEASLLHVSVADTGIGIGADVLPRLFAAFEQADASMARRYGGTGLGLAISRRLVRLMGGEIAVRSEPGRGSTFEFRLRLRRGAAAAAARRSTEAPAELAAVRQRLRARFGGTRVLLAEDNETNQEVALALLGDVGLEVDVAANGREAVALAARNPYPLMLIDMQMPVMDGLEATREVRALDGHATTPIVALTANAFAADRQRCLEAGMNDHLGKPVLPEVLYRCLLRWLETQTADASR